MSFEISPHIRLVGLVGLLLIVLAGGASLMLGRSGSSPVTEPAPGRHRTTTTAHTQTTAKPSAHGTKTPATKTGQKTHVAATPTTKTATAHATKPKTAHTPAHRGNLVDIRLPAALQWQLSQHKIVVVSLYDPQSDVDSISVAEAHAGATDAGAGFLLVNVLDNAVAGPLTALLPGGGLLPDPGVLVYRAPGIVAFRMDGFNDRDAVAQAAANAAAGQFDPSLGTTAP